MILLRSGSIAGACCQPQAAVLTPVLRAMQSSMQLQAAQLSAAEHQAAQLQVQVQKAEAQAAAALRDSGDAQRMLPQAQSTIAMLQREVDALQADLAAMHR